MSSEHEEIVPSYLNRLTKVPLLTSEEEVELTRAVQHGAAVLRGAKAQVVAARRGLSYPERRAVELDAFVRTWIHPDHWAAVDRVLPSANGTRPRDA